jgi:transposase
MLQINSSTRVFLCSQAIDMRYSFDALAGLVNAHFAMNPTCGYFFVFFSKRRDRMKLLFWDREGFAMFYKRLEHGTFSWLDELALSEGGEMDAADFAMVLAGINPVSKLPADRKKKLVTPRVPPLQLV